MKLMWEMWETKMMNRNSWMGRGTCSETQQTCCHKPWKGAGMGILSHWASHVENVSEGGGMTLSHTGEQLGLVKSSQQWHLYKTPLALGYAQSNYDRVKWECRVLGPTGAFYTSRHSHSPVTRLNLCQCRQAIKKQYKAQESQLSPEETSSVP